MADKNTIKNWFRTGLIPTQAQFWATWDSYWHKDEKLPISTIENIESILDQKADSEALTNHLTDENAHAGLFAKIRFIPYGELLVFEQAGKTTTGVLAAGDWCQGFVEGELINATYLGGDPNLLTSYDI